MGHTLSRRELFCCDGPKTSQCARSPDRANLAVTVIFFPGRFADLLSAKTSRHRDRHLEENHLRFRIDARRLRSRCCFRAHQSALSGARFQRNSAVHADLRNRHHVGRTGRKNWHLARRMNGLLNVINQKVSVSDVKSIVALLTIQSGRLHFHNNTDTGTGTVH